MNWFPNLCLQPQIIAEILPIQQETETEIQQDPFQGPKNSNKNLNNKTFDLWYCRCSDLIAGLLVDIMHGTLEDGRFSESLRCYNRSSPFSFRLSTRRGYQKTLEVSKDELGQAFKRDFATGHAYRHVEIKRHFAALYTCIRASSQQVAMVLATKALHYLCTSMKIVDSIIHTMLLSQTFWVNTI